MWPLPLPSWLPISPPVSAPTAAPAPDGRAPYSPQSDTGTCSTTGCADSTRAVTMDCALAAVAATPRAHSAARRKVVTADWFIASIL